MCIKCELKKALLGADEMLLIQTATLKVIAAGTKPEDRSPTGYIKETMRHVQDDIANHTLKLIKQEARSPIVSTLRDFLRGEEREPLSKAHLNIAALKLLLDTVASENEGTYGTFQVDDLQERTVGDILEKNAVLRAQQTEEDADVGR